MADDSVWRSYKNYEAQRQKEKIVADASLALQGSLRFLENVNKILASYLSSLSVLALWLSFYIQMGLKWKDSKNL